MSVKSVPNANKHHKCKKSATPSPGFFEDDVGQSRNSQKKVRRIRRTNDMICFNASVHEKKFIQNKPNSKLPEINGFSSPFFEEFNVKPTAKITKELSPDFTREIAINKPLSGGKFTRSSTTLTEILEPKKPSEKRHSKLPEKDRFSSPVLEDTIIKSTVKRSDVKATFTKELSPDFTTEIAADKPFFSGKFTRSSTTLTEISESRKPSKNRKIVKAKRFFKNNNEPQKPTDDQVHHDVAVEDMNDLEITFTRQTKIQENEDIWTGEEPHVSEVKIKKNSLNIHGMMVKTLPSPISPSETCIEINTHSSSHLQFNCSEENVNPSTNGIVNPTKRRTYELEDSIIDLSLLKSVSKRDSVRINSCPSSEDSQDYKTPSKITMRRKWNKPQQFSPYLSESPRWLSNQSPKKSLCLSEKIEKQDVQKAVSTSKKFVSKVKMPNFAAIHAKALQKVESISDYKQRKDERAKMLLSGLKPKNVQKSSNKKDNCSTQKSSSKKKSRKHLRFAQNSSLKEKSPTFIPLPSTPLPKNIKHLMNSPLTPHSDENKKFNCVFAKENKSSVTDALKSRNVEKKMTPVKSWCQDQFKKFNFVFAKENKCTQIPVCKQSNVEKGVLTVKNCNIKETFKPFTFNPVTKEAQKNQIKSIVTKSKPVNSTLESRRCAIKGVRSNRRFELLMNMRKGK